MPGNVTGYIGQESVSLENAATESTLVKLLQAIKDMAGSSAASKVAGVASAAGVDPKTIKSVNDALNQAKDSTEEYSDAEKEAAKQLLTNAGNTTARFNFLNSSILTLMAGTMQTSDLVGNFGKLIGDANPALGLFVSGMAKLIAMQEENFKSYQELSSTGINFAGSLTQLRMAAANSYLTIGEFSKVMKENSESFAKMGGTANDGAMAFSRVNKELIQGDVGSKLMAMGLTAEDVSSGLANYIAISGGRNAKEMQQTEKLAKAAGEYITELDDLAQITGKSRQQQEQALKEASANEAYQAYLLTLDEEGKKKANIAMAEAMATGGKGAAQALQSQLMGLPPITKAAQEFTTVAPKMAAANNKMAAAVGDASKGVSDIKRAGDEMRIGAVQTKQDLGMVGTAVVAGGTAFSGIMGTILGTANKAEQQGIKTIEDAEKQRKSLEANRQAREESQADDMAKAMAGFKELGAELWQVFSPLLSVVSFLARMIGGLAGGIGSVIKKFNSVFEYFGPLSELFKGLVVAGIAYLAIQRMASAQALTKAGMDKALELVRGGAGRVGNIATAVSGKASGALGGVTKMAETGSGGGGGGLVSFIKSLGRGLASLAPIAVPMLIGAGAVAGVIAILGAGVASAVALIGVSLPTFAKGLSSLAEINGVNLLTVAAGIAALGGAIIAFTVGSLVGGLGAIGSKILNFFSGGGPIEMILSSVETLGPVLPQLVQLGPAIDSYAQGIVAFGKAVSGVDLAKAEKLKDVLKGPGVLEGIGSAIKDVGSATAKLMTMQSGGQEKSSNDIADLNNTMREMLKYIKDTADNTKRTHDATKALNGNLYA